MSVRIEYSRFFIVLIFCLLMTDIGSAAQAPPEHVQKIVSQPVKKAPDTPLSRALTAGHTGNSPEEVKAQITYIENALAKYGTGDPWASRAFYLMAMAQFNLGKYQEALANLDACVKLPEPYSGLHLAAQQMRMMVQERLGNRSGAIEASRDLMKTDGPVDQKRIYQGTALLLRAEWQAASTKAKDGGMKAAAESYREFLRYQKKYPSKTGQKYNAFALRSLGGALEHSGETKKALAIYSDYLRKYPRSLDAIRVAMDRLGIQFKGLANIPTTELEKILAKYPTNSGYGQQVFYQLGFNYFANNQFDEASKALHKAWNMTPDKRDTQYSEDLAGKAAIMEMRSLNLAGMAVERDSVARQIISRFKGTEYAQEAERALAAYNADTQTFWGSGLIKGVAIVVVLMVVGFRVYVQLRERRSS